MWQYDRIDIMIDAESLALKSNSPALPAISAAIFNIETGDIYDEIFIPICLESLNNFDIEGASLKFWFTQPTELQQTVLLNKKSVSIEQGLVDLYDFISSIRTDTKQLAIWVCGPLEDARWLQSAFEIELHRPAPWSFSEIRDVRTIRDMGRSILGIDPDQIEFIGTRHHPKDDVRHQIKYVSRIWEGFVRM